MSLESFFGNPRALIFVPIFLLALGCLSYFSQLHRKKIENWINPDLWVSIIPDFSVKKFKLKYFFLTLSVLFLCLAYARPQWGEQEQILNTQGMDIFFLVDLSNSMLAEDSSPSRLGRAQSFIKKTLQHIENDRVGIIGFAGSAELSVPLTNDFQYVSDVVDTLDPATISNQGTNITSAIDAATRALDRSAEDDSKISRAIVLITDGEDFGESPMEAAKNIKKFGAGFYAVSVGTTDGAPIPIRSNGVLQTYKKDSSGKTVLSRVNKDILAKIAEEAGGKYFELVNPEDAAYSLTRDLQRYSRSNQQEQRVISKIERFEWFLLLAVISLFLYLSTGYRKARIIFLLLMIPFASSHAADTGSLKTYLKGKEGAAKFKEEKFDDSARAFQDAENIDQENPTLYYNEGTALANAGKTEEAISQLQAATQKSLLQGDYGTAARSLYNEGIAQDQNKNQQEAYDRLTKSIEMAKITNQPDVEKKAREALTRMAIKQKEQSGQDQKQDKDKKQDQKKDKNKNDDKGEGKEKEDKGDKQDKNENSPKDVAKKREFRSGTLSKDTAESIMNDLSDREKQLYHQRLKDKKRKDESSGNDW